MRTIDEIKKELLDPFLYIDEMENLINELIETVATLQREKCAKEAKLLIDDKGQYYYEDSMEDGYLGDWVVTVSKESILNAKL